MCFAIREFRVVMGVERFGVVVIQESEDMDSSCASVLIARSDTRSFDPSTFYNRRSRDEACSGVISQHFDSMCSW